MPTSQENKLKRAALRKYGSTSSVKARRYIYGTMRKTGWRPERENKEDND